MIVLKDKLIVALDVPSLKEAEKLVKTLSPVVKIFKVGKELFTSAGPDAIRMVHSHKAKVFLDLKFHDIPNTVAAACEAATRLGVFMLNVHSLGGKQMLFSAVQAVHKTAAELKQTPPLLLGVTVLTSLVERDLADIGIKMKLKREVEKLALLSRSCGLDGVVASAQEIETIRKAAGKDFVIVTPGVRPVWAAKGDQKRVMTPSEAIEKGAHFIVVGRPITHAPDPKAAAKRIFEEMTNL
ncbi:MAG: orotidine-5'-phosphate decarboxylase [Candidatus Omnitrophota bacterium]